MKAQWEPTHWTHNTHNVKALREKLCLGKMWSFTELESCLLLSDRRACKDVHLFLMSGCPWKSCQTRTCRSSAMSNILQISLQSAQKWIHNTTTTYLLPSMTSPGVFHGLCHSDLNIFGCHSLTWAVHAVWSWYLELWGGKRLGVCVETSQQTVEPRFATCVYVGLHIGGSFHIL